jgi:hypothetical protein
MSAYRTGRCRRINERRFVRRRAELDGRLVDYLLHNQRVGLLKGKLRLRQVRRLCESGHQTQVGPDYPIAPLGGVMTNRLSSETQWLCRFDSAICWATSERASAHPRRIARCPPTSTGRLGISRVQHLAAPFRQRKELGRKPYNPIGMDFLYLTEIAATNFLRRGKL